MPPGTGTNPLTTLGGYVTSPLGGPTLTWTGDGTVFTAVAASGKVSTSKGGATTTAAGTGAPGATAKSGSAVSKGMCKVLWIFTSFGFLFGNL